MTANDNNKKNLTYGIILSICALLIFVISIFTMDEVKELTYTLIPISITIFMYGYAFLYTYYNINKLQENETYEKDKNYILDKKSKIISITFKLQVAIFLIIWISFAIFLAYTVFEFQTYQGLLILIPFILLLAYLIKVICSYLLKNN